MSAMAAREAALAFARRHWHVFPCHSRTPSGACTCGHEDCNSPAKHPRTVRGFMDATDDDARIAASASLWANSNVGIATGAVSGLLVLDVDDGGAETLARLEGAHGALPATIEVLTGGGGRHVYFRHPGRPVKSSARRAPGIDFRGDGGYVIGPPSVHIAGTSYRWAPGRGPDEVELAEAPPWILELADGPPAARASALATQTSRAPGVGAGAGAAAAGDVERARRYLANVPPAIEGEGGDAHTYRVACIVVNDFALSDSDALHVLLEWNQTCSPPWDERDIQRKIQHAKKYARKAPGEKSGPWEPHMQPPQQPGPGPEPQEAADAPRSGPTAVRFRNGRPVIPIDLDVKPVVDASDRAIASKPDLEVFQRGGVLVRVRRDEPDGAPRSSVERDPTSPLIVPIARATLLELVACAAYFEKYTKDGPERVLPPPWAVDALHARGAYSSRVLRGFAEAPFLRPDGTIATQRGYDEATGVYLASSLAMDPIPDEPTLADAQAARAELLDVIEQFPYVDDSDRSTALAAMITPVVRHAITGPVPLFGVTATAPGTGKGFLVDVCGIIATGRPPARFTAPPEEREARKELLAVALAGDPIVLIDNVSRPLGGDALEAALTACAVRGRLLGFTQIVEAPMSAVIYATGNNMGVRGDMGRRFLPVNLDAKQEQPDERKGWKYDPLHAHVRRIRARLVRAALVLCRAYQVAAPRLDQPLDIPAFGSYESWSKIVREPLVWLGMTDPCAGRQRVREDADVDREVLSVLLETWYRVIGPDALLLAGVLERAAKVPEFAAAIGGLNEKFEPGKLDPKALGYALRRHRGRIVNSYKLEQTERICTAHGDGKGWRVVKGGTV